MQNTDRTISNNHITEELQRFRCAPGPAFYALQIDAPWGAGKTHFIRSYLEKECGPSIGPGEVNPEPRHIVVSMFGAASVADLETQVVAQLFTSGERLVGRLASSVIGAAAAYVGLGVEPQEELERQGPRLLSDRLKKLRDRGGIVVFDDIERARIPLSDALGYVNRFIEHEGFKVVLVTNEAALDREDASEGDQANFKDLRRFKEKLVGRTLALSPMPDKAYDAFVASMASEDAQRLAAQGREGALALFHASGRDNLRSVRMGLETFDRLVPVFEPAWLERTEAMQEVLLGCLFVAIELVGGTVREALASPARGRIRGLPGRDQNESDRAQNDAHRIVDTYEDYLSLEGPPIPFPTLLALVADGRLLEDEVRKRMSQSPLVVGSQVAPPWRILIEVWDLDIEGSKQAVERTREQFRESSVVDPGELLHLVGIMLWRSDYGDLSLSDDRPVKEFIKSYLVRLREKNIILRPDLRPFRRQPYLMAYGYSVIGASDGREDLLDISDMIRESILGSVRDRFPEFRLRLLEELARSNYDLSDFKTESDFQVALELPIFEGWEVETFADFLMREGRFDYRAMEWLATGRYGKHQRLEPLASEVEWFEGLCNTLRRRIAAVPPPFSNFWRKALDSLADPALARLQQH